MYVHIQYILAKDSIITLNRWLGTNEPTKVADAIIHMVERYFSLRSGPEMEQENQQYL